jgi:hypothetical protein
MNIYKFHTNPESLDHFKEVTTRIPKFAFEHAAGFTQKIPRGRGGDS